MRLEVEPEGLLVASEIGPCRVVNRHVGFSTDKVRLRLVAVERKHLRHLCVDSIGGVVAHRKVLRVKELSNAEVSCRIREHVDGLDGRGVVGRPFDVNLHGHLGCRLNHGGDGVQPVHMTGKDGRTLGVKPQVVGEVERDVRWWLVVGIQSAVVVAVPIRRQISVFNLIEINVGSCVVVIVVVDGVWAG